MGWGRLLRRRNRSWLGWWWGGWVGGVVYCLVGFFGFGLCGGGNGLENGWIFVEDVYVGDYVGI